MNTNRLPCFLILLVILTCSTLAQDQYIVMSTKGKAEYTTLKSTKWKKLKVGQVLGNNEVIRTSYASYVKLMVNAERIVSIDANSTRPLAEYSARKRKEGGESVSGKILRYAADQMKRTTERKTTTEFGAVRGVVDIFSAVFPKYSVMTTTPKFEWIDSDSAMSYELMLLDANFNTLDIVEVSEMKFLYEKGAELIQNGKTYHWRVTRLTDGEFSDVQTFMVLMKDTVEHIRSEIARLDKELEFMGVDEVTMHLIRAIYFDKKGLYSDAFKEYKETIALAPDVEEYRGMMRELLLNMRLYNEQEYILK